MDKKIIAIVVCIIGAIAISSYLNNSTHSTNQQDDVFDLLDGKKFYFNSLKGKIVVLEFFEASCNPCKETAPNIEKVYAKFRNNDKVSVIGIAVKKGSIDINLIKDFVINTSISYPIIIDDGRLTKKFNAFSVPTTIILGADSTIIKRFLGAVPEVHKAIIKEISKLT